jgi:transposase
MALSSRKICTVSSELLAENPVEFERRRCRCLVRTHNGRMKTSSSLVHERIDDVPLLIGLAQKLQLGKWLDHHLGKHGSHQGLSLGALATGWIAFILSRGNHTKVHVEQWTQDLHHTLSHLLGQPLRPAEFSDDRLGIFLRRLQELDDWHGLETAIWHGTCEVYELPIDRVRLDSTTTCGYHTITPEGLMQLGHSKDHRPDLPQLKIMAAAAEPSGHLIVTDYYSGQTADDPLYLPMTRRVRSLLGRTGLLYVGDCKMAALATRAELAAEGDYYLMPLPMTSAVQKQFDAWLDQVLSGQLKTQELQHDNEFLGYGVEWTRRLQAKVNGKSRKWKERVQLLRSPSLMNRQQANLEERLRRAEQALYALTPPVGPGKKQCRDEGSLQANVTAILERCDVADLLSVTWEKQEFQVNKYVGPGRGSAKRATQTEVQVRYQITQVRRESVAIESQRQRLGWRVQVSNAPKKRMSLLESVLWYRSGWSLERDFHLLKDKPLGIRPLYVKSDEQIGGLVRLMTLALRMLSIIEMQGRRGVAATGKKARGYYSGQPGRQTDRPSGQRILETVTRQQVTLFGTKTDTNTKWQLPPLPEIVKQILGFLGLCETLYTGLTQPLPTSSQSGHSPQEKGDFHAAAHNSS